MLNIKGDILKNVGNQSVMFPLDFYSISFSTMEVNGNQQLFDSSKFFKISCVQHEKETYRSLERHDGG